MGARGALQVRWLGSCRACPPPRRITRQTPGPRDRPFR